MGAWSDNFARVTDNLGAAWDCGQGQDFTGFTGYWHAEPTVEPPATTMTVTAADGQVYEIEMRPDENGILVAHLTPQQTSGHGALTVTTVGNTTGLGAVTATITTAFDQFGQSLQQAGDALAQFNFGPLTLGDYSYVDEAKRQERNAKARARYAAKKAEREIVPLQLVAPTRGIRI